MKSFFFSMFENPNNRSGNSTEEGDGEKEQLTTQQPKEKKTQSSYIVYYQSIDNQSIIYATDHELTGMCCYYLPSCFNSILSSMCHSFPLLLHLP